MQAAEKERGLSIKEVSQKFGISQDTLRYYEKVGMIPPVTRTAGGIRSYGPADQSWVSLATCMRGAGLPVEVMCEYVKLYRQGDATIRERLQLLIDQRDALMNRKKQIEATLKRLNFKIARYEIAAETGSLPPLSEEDRKRFDP